LEGLILSGEGFHQAPSPGWITLCRERLPEIAAAYLARLDGGDVRGFFGSWLHYRGIKYAGYFLGYRFIRYLEERITLREIALLPRARIGEAARSFLRRTAKAEVK